MLKLNVNDYNDRILSDDLGISYREFRDVTYVEHPVSPIQKLNIFVPLAYYHQGTINGYTAKTAPIFMPNTVGGYMPGPRDFPGNAAFPNNSTTIVKAIEHGYVVISAGLRGRSLTDETKRFIGKAPAFLVDMKAAIRYVRHNQQLIPGNVEQIITNGTSAGGATSATVGTSGNAQFFEKYLQELGAANESDAIYAASCYCPIHNLEHADAAYEWEFNNITDWNRVQMVTPPHETTPPVFKKINGELTAEEKDNSKILKDEFVKYLNGLSLIDANGNRLSLNADGTGSFLEYVKDFIEQSAQKALDSGQKISADTGVHVDSGVVNGLDWDKYLQFITRMKGVPAFDDLKMQNPEPNLFGDGKTASKHFTKFSQSNSQVKSQLADSDLIKAINPLTYIKSADGQTAKYWRIRHGASDRDTSFAIPVILATLLRNAGFDVDFAMPWATPHSGDYDLRDLFTWIDKICAKN
ncbi:subtype B tannase [Companilactobacillus alimentarius]|uniref:subtype B tannase n=1 Tax=Companilactobacillus alimentarius TaxID=1602 RepID=UPI0006F1B410|nr:subtype B tannase [Companilactobacillus alimentarius]KRK77605.1 tannase [Companilactobacillus alimentarius DSM 20249]MDT6952005.1 subtype B tannase [Companilactobacillus alimentarius]GEO45222.1 tannase [Companilactobacillus alimentarius]